MDYSLEAIKGELQAAIAQICGVKTEVHIEPANPSFGADLAVPCFAFAKALRQSPVIVAQRIVEFLRHPSLERAEATGGFVNLWLKPASLAQGLWQDLQLLGNRFGEHSSGQGKTVIVEFPSPNMAKPFSVGHLRPANQGWALTQLMKAMGYTVITDNHLGDWGTPFGKWVIGFKRYSSEAALKQDGIYELARVYMRITAVLKAEKEAGNHDLADEVQEWLLKLEAGDAEATAFAQKFSAISLDHMHKVMKRLFIATDYEYGEAFYVEKGKKLVEELIQKNIAQRQDDGSVIVDLRKQNIETPILLKKSNGAALYATSDLATLAFREETWQPDKVIYVVAAEQQFYFKQLFALAAIIGYKTEYVHYWFGLIDQLNEDGTRSKMSSRSGVVLLEELLDTAEQKAREYAANPTDLSDEAAAQIALGAIKFTDFSQDKKTAILFDWKRIFNLQGFSGPYVQYAAVRIGSILEKLGQGKWHKDAPYDWQAERELLLRLSAYPEVVRLAAEQYEPHRVAQYLYDQARALNRYYENTSIVQTSETEVKELRLWLLNALRHNFAHGLNLLGIEIPAKM